MAINQVTLSTQFSEWKDITNAIIDAIGDNVALSTTDTSTLVAAINEVLTKLGAVANLNTTDKASVVAAVNEVFADLGDVSTLDGSLVGITNAIDAINAAIDRIGDLTTLNTTFNSDLVGAINEVNTALADSISDFNAKIGDLTTLNTTDKTSSVAAINELVGSIGDLTTLTTTDQSSAVAAINELVTSLGDLGDITTLTTTNKTSAVHAINELKAEQLTEDFVQLDNQMTNRGRFATETVKAVSTFDSTMFQMGLYNATTAAAGEKFIDDNSNYGGLGGSLGTDIGALMTALQAAGRTDNRNGFEFYIADYTMGGSTSDPEVYSGNNYYPFLEGDDSYLGRIGTTLTFQCWVRVKSMTDAPTHTGIVVGHPTESVDTYLDGVDIGAQDFIEVADGWTHLRQQWVITSEYKQFFPMIYANVGDVIQIALPTLYNADVSRIHLGVS